MLIFFFKLKMAKEKKTGVRERKHHLSISSIFPNVASSITRHMMEICTPKTGAIGT